MFKVRQATEKDVVQIRDVAAYIFKYVLNQALVATSLI